MSFNDKLPGCYNPFYRKIFLKGHNTYIWVACPCGHCISCYRKYEKEWKMRMREEMASSKSSFFVTLTYNDFNVPFNGNNMSLCKSDYQKFLKRLRKSLSILDIKLRYVICGEYGSNTNRPHYHFALFLNGRLPFSVFYDFINKSWDKGFIQVKFLDIGKIKYLSKYFNKLDDRWHNVDTFRNMSNGIGKSFLSKNIIDYYKKNKTYTVHRFGSTYTMPRYYRDKIFNKYVQESILLDKQKDYINWICDFISVHGNVNPYIHYAQNNIDALNKAKIHSVKFLDDDVILFD